MAKKRKKKKKEPEEETYEIKVEDWEAAYRFGLNTLPEDLIQGVYWERARLIHKMDIHISDIPPEYKDLQSDMEFNPDDMQRLFEFGYNRSVNGKAWWTQPAVENHQELIEKISPGEALEEMEARPEFRRIEMWRHKE